MAEVSSLRSNSDLTHWRPAAFNGYGTGGWWNFGGILREVYMRRIDTVDVEDVHVLPRLRARGRGGEGRGAHHAAQLHEARPRRLARDPRGRPADPATTRRRVPALGRRELSKTVPSRTRGCGQPRAPELYGMTVGAVDATRKEREHLPARVRREQDRRAPGRGDPAERQAPQPARRERP